MLRLTALHVYPIKSASGCSVREWEVDSFGLRYDRRWMVVDRSGRFITQRTHPRLALVRPTIDGDTMRVATNGMPLLELPLQPAPDVATTAVLWHETCEAVWTGERSADWFSEVLGTPCSLVHMPTDTVRPADPAFAPPGVRVSFADAFPFLLISEESLEDLNARLPTPLPMNRFRPNLVIAGSEPLRGGLARPPSGSARSTSARSSRATDAWSPPPTRRPPSAAWSRSEPWRRIARSDGEVMFGQNVIHLGTGRLSVGAPLLV